MSHTQWPSVVSHSFRDQVLLHLHGNLLLASYPAPYPQLLNMAYIEAIGNPGMVIVSLVPSPMFPAFEGGVLGTPGMRLHYHYATKGHMVAKIQLLVANSVYNMRSNTC